MGCGKSGSCTAIAVPRLLTFDGWIGDFLTTTITKSPIALSNTRIRVPAFPESFGIDAGSRFHICLHDSSWPPISMPAERNRLLVWSLAGCCRVPGHIHGVEGVESGNPFGSSQVSGTHQIGLMQVSWIRKVDGRGHIDVNGKTYFIRRRLSGQYVIATLFTHRQRLVIKQESKRIKSFPFPIQESKIIPLLSFIKGRS